MQNRSIFVQMKLLFKFANFDSKQECIPVGCVPSAAVAVTDGASTPRPGQAPPRCGPGDPLARSPSTSPWVRAWRPPCQIPLNFPQGVGLETCKACWDTIPPLENCCKAWWDTTWNACWDTPPPPVNRMTDRCKNITLPQTSFAGGNNLEVIIQYNEKITGNSLEKGGKILAFWESGKVRTLHVFIERRSFMDFRSSTGMYR